MKKIKIDGKEYTFEFTIEASLCDECVESVMGLFARIGEAKNKKDIRALIGSMANVPRTAFAMFYAGLIEHHGEDGDETILTKKDAKDLVKKFFDENKEETFHSLMEKMFDCMADDGFFERIGLDKMFETNQTEKVAKVPQDHKKKATKATEK